MIFEIIELFVGDVDLLLLMVDDFLWLGFGVEVFGGGVVVVCEMLVILGEVNVIKLICDILDELNDLGDSIML